MPNPLTLLIPIAETVQPLEILQTIAQNQSTLNQALGVVGTVHYARFVLLDRAKPNLQFDPKSPSANTGQLVLAVITEYDGDFSTYVKAFVKQIGKIFDALLAFSADGTQLIPVEQNADAFVDYVKRNDTSTVQPTLFAAYPYSVNQIIGEIGGDSGASAS